MKTYQKLFTVAVFATAFGFVESSVVVYLRALYYPEGFSFPLAAMQAQHLLVELAREFSTIVMLVTVGLLAGNSRWQKFSYFLVAFGVWDIFYYIWLKVILHWPASLFDWDILFLIPVPWIGPVIAPVLISLVMIASGILIIRHEAEGKSFHPSLSVWLVSITSSAVILYTFMNDTGATLRFEMPRPYQYEFFIPALLLLLLALSLVFRGSKKEG